MSIKQRKFNRKGTWVWNGYHEQSPVFKDGLTSGEEGPQNKIDAAILPGN